MSNTQRFLADRHRRLEEFTYLFLVRCPRCQHCARVIPEPDPARETFSPYFVRRVRLLCTFCGMIREKDGCGRMRVDGPRDWYFFCPLYLQIPCAGHILWALNLEHLSYLEQYIQASIREGSTRIRIDEATTYDVNMIARLPQWMKDAKHRKEIVRCIHKLRASVVS